MSKHTSTSNYDGISTNTNRNHKQQVNSPRTWTGRGQWSLRANKITDTNKKIIMVLGKFREEIIGAFT